MTEIGGAPGGWEPFEDLLGPLSHHADLDFMHELAPRLQTLRSWLKGSGNGAFEAALNAVGPQVH
ncbi:hypothetical protein [uncultured Sphingomonas sp.]|uniref:hypothetical protein n=1 Tax=uncultured Sphingomonas sp. TaxID=158754 RepID=UPI0035CADB9E